MWPFGRKPALSAAKADWIDAHFDWALAAYGEGFFARRRLILPTRTFFTAAGGRDHATAKAVLYEVAAHLDIDGPVELEPQFSLPDEWSHRYDQLSQTAGTFALDGNTAIISYDPKLLARPVAFISTMAHELMHYRLAGVIQDLPGGEATHEGATDLHCIFWGFGTFQLQTAEDLGWAGYLGQDSRAYALARFLAASGTDPALARAHLSSRPAARLNRAMRDMQRMAARGGDIGQ